MPTGPKRDYSRLNERLASMGADIVKPYHGAPADTSWSDAPGFKPVRFAGEHVDEQGVKASKIEHLLDPEKHVEFISRYAGSSDLIHPFHGRMTFGQMKSKKLAEAMQPEGAVNEAGRPLHGAGIFESVREHGVQNPIRTVTNEEHYPRSKGHLVQTEGHHRLFSAAEAQRQKREAGEKDWGMAVPFTMHSTVEEARTADALNARLLKAKAGIAKLKASRTGSFQVGTQDR